MSDDTPKKKRRPKGDGSFQVLPDGRYKIQITVGYDQKGKQVRKSFTGTSKREVISMLNKFKSDQLKGTLVAPSALTLFEFTTRWLKMKKIAVKAKSYDSYDFTITKHITPFLGKKKVQKMTTTDINNYLVSKAEQGLSAATLSQHRAILHNVLDLAVKEGVIGRNIVETSNPIPRERKEMKVLTDDQIEQLLAKARDYKSEVGKHDKYVYKFIYPFILLALATGCRRGELLALRWRNIDDVNNTITIHQNLVEIRGKAIFDTPKTEGSRRTVAVEPRVLQVLKEEIWDDNQDGLVFHTEEGTPIPFSTLRRLYKKVKDACGIKDIRLHDLRHTHVTSLISSGHNIKMVSKRVGHSDIRTTLGTYAHALPEEDREAATFIGNKLIKQKNDKK